jgi:cytoskeletal protein CcmA (bactofilin family)
MPTRLGRTIQVEGEIRGKDAIVLLGRLTGRIDTQGRVEIAASAEVHADIAAGEAVIQGRVTGDIKARERVELLDGSELIGDVQAPRIAIADGARFSGKVQREP